MSNILLISYYFPPLNTVACRRVYAWAKYLHKLGHRVTVLTAQIKEPEAKKSFNVDLSFLDIHRKGYFDIRYIFPSLFYAKSSLKKGGNGSLLAKLAGKGRSILSDKGVLLGGARVPTFSDLWFYPALKEAKNIVKNAGIDIVITSSPPPVVHLIGSSLKKCFRNILWVEDFRDLWTLNPLYRGIFLFRPLEKSLESKCIARSDIITTVSEPLVRYLQERYPARKADIFCVENGFDEEVIAQFNLLPGALKKKQNKRIVYLGTLYKGRRNPEILFRAVHADRDFFAGKLEIIFFGSFFEEDVLRRLASKYPATEGIISYGGFAGLEESIKAQSEADALLFMESDKSDDGWLSAKIFEYMAFKKPILCLGVSPLSYVGKMLERTGLCVFCSNDIIEVKNKLKSLIEGDIRICPDERYIGNFSHEGLVKKLNGLIGGYIGA